MQMNHSIRSFHWTTVLLAALSLSIGWGIRGNFGHEYGAMIPGALCALALALLTGREDWRRRAPYFAMFGALGWGFGGSISYMQVIAYTHSGHLPSQLYGFSCLFVIGFLWAALGGAGTAWPATADQERLTALFRPLLWIFGTWFAFSVFLLPAIEQWESSHAQTWSRHESPLYWYDSDWLQALTALLAVFLFDLWDRRREKNLLTLPLFAAAGALFGFLAALLPPVRALAAATVQYQGDLDAVRAEALADGVPPEQYLSQLLINWPQFFKEVPEHLGWGIGLFLGVCAFFWRYGKFRSGASLFVYMAGGWLISFIALPTLLGFGGAGLRMTPPRGDDWAGILGVWIGTMLWLRRERLYPILFASIVSGAIGGLGFAGASWMKLLLTAPGNPALTQAPSVIAAWRHWQSANWHSVLEQSYGFINGIAIAVAIGLIAVRVAPLDTPRIRRWTKAAAVAFVLLLLLFVNIFKNVHTWVNDYKIVPARMTMPLFESIELSAQAWFILIWCVLSATVLIVMARHLRQPIALVPENPLGQGQLIYLVFLWAIVVANLERALGGFSDGRLITEGVLFLNAAAASLLLLLAPRPAASDFPVQALSRAQFTRAGLGLVAAVLIAAFGMTFTVRLAYGDAHAGHSSLMKRFGPDATWRVAPLQKGASHS